jgi:hypothetical protein
MSRQFSTFLLLILSQLISAQTYTPIDTANLAVRKEISKVYLNNAKLFVANIKKEYSGSEKYYIKTQFEEHNKRFNTELLNGHYIFDKRFDTIVDSITSLLRKGNLTIPADLKFYISRNISLNASSMGDNTFIINMGSFYYLENENELAALIAHEIGHFLLKHQLLSLQRHFKLDKVVSKTQLSEIKRDRYNRGTKALERFKSIMYSDQNSNRQEEHEADSIGYIIYKKSGFPTNDYLNSYKLLAEYDSIKPKGLEIETYRKLFNFQGLNFKTEWLKREDFSGYDYTKYSEKLNKDSIRSHPETDARIKRLVKLFPELADSGKITPPSKNFDSLSNIVKYEQVASLDFNEDYGTGVYLCMFRLQTDSSETYYKNWLGHFFEKIYDARKTYTLNRYLDRVEPKVQSDSYQQFINFMWNLNINELKAIADYYTKKGS